MVFASLLLIVVAEVIFNPVPFRMVQGEVAPQKLARASEMEGGLGSDIGLIS